MRRAYLSVALLLLIRFLVGSVRSIGWIRTPTVAMILEASLAWVSRRKMKRSSISPSSGASTRTTTMPARTFGQPRPFCSSK
jgi:hypothetical protein